MREKGSPGPSKERGEMYKFPSVDIDGMTLFQVGCTKCGQGGRWQVFTDSRVWVALCPCGHRVELPAAVLRSKPDPAPSGLDWEPEDQQG